MHSLIFTIKQLHIILAVVSVSLFMLRFAGTELGARWIRQRWVKIAPHIVDTLLLASGITLAVLFRFSPLEANWLLVKLILIVFYILLGMASFKAEKRAARLTCATLGMVLIAGIVYMVRFKPL